MHFQPRTVIWLGIFLVARLIGAGAEPLPGEIRMQDVLVLKSVSRPSRSAVHTDPIEAAMVSGLWHVPTEGETVITERGERAWEKATPGADGWLQPTNMRGGYVCWTVTSQHEQVMILEAAGHNLAYVNGEIRAGDPYAYGYVRLPVVLHPGTNDLLFQCSRGRFTAKLTPADGPLMFNTADTTLPDIRLGEEGPVRGGVVLLNTTTNSFEAQLRTEGAKATETTVSLPALSARKAGFLFHPPLPKEAGDCSFILEASQVGTAQKVIARTELKLRVRRPDQTFKRTFVSSIDDSIQYYAVNPASGSPAPALFLSLHGASVEAIGQADAYSSKRWGNIVCPTNRRPYGFDWEEWGRLDALEVLAEAEAAFHPDPARIYLTGHSMGGHGTWQLGAIYPDRFAAIGPSAGWISFTSYVETNGFSATNGASQILRRAAGASDTLLMLTNYLQEGVFILHGDADDNVPVSEARHMRELLGQFHRDLDYHEQPGAGHWWDASDEPGADCVDWAPMFDYFAHHVVPSDESMRHVQFTTLNPTVSSHCHWVTILSQEHALEPSGVDVRCDPMKRRVQAQTTNVAELCFELPWLSPEGPLTIELDGQKLENIPWPMGTDSTLGEVAGGRSRGPTVWLAHEQGRWALGHVPTARMKNPRRSGPFRLAFGNHMLFICGTHGTPEENRWIYAKARYDAETFWYRGNGSVQIITDTAFLQKPKEGSHSVILYGNADCNSAWSTLLKASGVRVRRGSVQIGEKEIVGENLACLFLQPYPGDAQALIGVVAGSGIPGLRLTERLPYFQSGGGFPDCLVIGTEMLTDGPIGVRLAGFFGPDWGVNTGEFGGAQ